MPSFDEDWNGDERRLETTKMREQIAALNKRMARFEVAMFARDDDNEFGRPGLMVTADRLDNHLDALCKAWKFGRALVIGVFSSFVAILSLGKWLGWWHWGP